MWHISRVYGMHTFGKTQFILTTKGTKGHKSRVLTENPVGIFCQNEKTFVLFVPFVVQNHVSLHLCAYHRSLECATLQA